MSFFKKALLKITFFVKEYERYEENSSVDFDLLYT